MKKISNKTATKITRVVCDVTGFICTLVCTLFTENIYGLITVCLVGGMLIMTFDSVFDNKLERIKEEEAAIEDMIADYTSREC